MNGGEISAIRKNQNAPYEHTLYYNFKHVSSLDGGSRPAVQERTVREKRQANRTPNQLERLAKDVWERIGLPVDQWAVVATLESAGWRDLDARQMFDYDDLFALADDVYPVCRELYEDEARKLERTVHEPTRLRRWWRTIRSYGRGFLFSIPVVGQIIAVLALGYSLWAWMYFTEAQATVVALGTLGSFIVTGGFTQCIGREGHRYLSTGEGRLAWKACFRLVWLGMAVVLTVAFFFLVLDVLFPFYPLRLMIISQMYFVLLSALWLTLSILYVLERHLAIVLFTLVGIGPVYAVMEYTTWGIYAAHGLGILCSIGISAAYGSLLLRRKAQQSEVQEGEASLPPLVVEFHDVRPYFLYGILFFAFLFVDRIIAWSVTEGHPPPYIIWFRTSYELGIDWALVSMLFTLAVLDHTIQTFSIWAAPKQRASTSSLRAAARQFRGFYYRQLAILLIIGGISVVGTFWGTLQLAQAGLVPTISDVVSDPVTRTVYWWAALSYLAAAVGLHNVLFFFTLNQPWFALHSAGPALIANLVVGFAASRWLGYEYAVVGLMAGSLAFAAFSFRYLRRIMNKFDYYYYSAF